MSKTIENNFKMRGANFKTDVQGKFFLHKDWYVPGKHCRGGGGSKYDRSKRVIR